MNLEQQRMCQLGDFNAQSERKKTQDIYELLLDIRDLLQSLTQPENITSGHTVTGDMIVANPPLSTRSDYS